MYIPCFGLDKQVWHQHHTGLICGRVKELESVSTVVISHFILLLQVDDVPFLINGNTQYLRGALSSVVADNPASNLIGEFKNLSSAYLATSEKI